MLPSPAGANDEPQFRQRIRAAYERFSPGYRRVADFLLDDYRAAAFLNASGLAQHLSVDPATIVRFAQRLGYPGYPELAKEIQETVKRELSAAFTPGADGPDQDAIRQLLQGMADDVERLLVVNGPDTVHALVEAIAQARRVALLADDGAAHAASLFGNQLRLAGVETILVAGDRVAKGRALLGAAPTDVALALSLDAADGELVAAVQTVRQHGLPVFAIVTSHSSPVARAANHIVLSPPSPGRQLPTHYVAALALLTAIAEVVAARRAPQVSANLAELDKWLERLAAAAASPALP